MKKLLFLFLFLMSFRVVQAQPGNPTINFRNADPSGTCSAQPMQYNYTLGKLWGCTAGTWTLIADSSGSSLTPCGPTVGEVQLFASSTTLGCDPLFFYDATNHSLRFGLAEPDLSGQDGPSNSWSVIHNFPLGGYNDAVFMAAGTSMAGDGASNVIDFYTSNGTTSAPTDQIAATIMMNLQSLGRSGGSYQYLASIGTFFLQGSGADGSLGSAFAGAINNTINDVTSNEIGHTFLWSPDGTALEFAIVNAGGPPTGIGFEPISAGVGECNNGTPSGSMGGALCAMTFGTVRSAYKSSDGTTGATVTACTAFKNGLCVSGT